MFYLVYNCVASATLDNAFNVFQNLQRKYKVYELIK